MDGVSLSNKSVLLVKSALLPCLHMSNVVASVSARTDIVKAACGRLGRHAAFHPLLASLCINLARRRTRRRATSAVAGACALRWRARCLWSPPSSSWTRCVSWLNLPSWCLPEWAACSRMHLLLAVHSLPSSLHGRGAELQPTLLAPLHPCSPPTTWTWRRACGWRTRLRTGSASCCWCRTRRCAVSAGWGVAGILRAALRQLHPACSFSRCLGCSGSCMEKMLVASASQWH